MTNSLKTVYFFLLIISIVYCGNIIEKLNENEYLMKYIPNFEENDILSMNDIDFLSGDQLIEFFRDIGVKNNDLNPLKTYLFERKPTINASNFSDNLSVSTEIQAKINILLDPYYYSEIWMTPTEIKAMTNYLDPTQTYLEYGSGGSTLSFCRIVKNCYSIEHNEEWYDSLSLNIEEDKDLKDKVELYFVPVTRDDWGGGFEEGTYDQFKDYVDQIDYIGIDTYDVVLVDGRSRAACLLKILKYVHRDSFIIVHDFVGRTYYHFILNFYSVIGHADSLVILRPKEEYIGRDLNDIININKIKNQVVALYNVNQFHYIDGTIGTELRFYPVDQSIANHGYTQYTLEIGLNEQNLGDSINKFNSELHINQFRSLCQNADNCLDLYHKYAIQTNTISVIDLDNMVKILRAKGDPTIADRVLVITGYTKQCWFDNDSITNIIQTYTDSLTDSVANGLIGEYQRCLCTDEINHGYFIEGYNHLLDVVLPSQIPEIYNEELISNLKNYTCE
eukprot:TRINITY_DN2450_c0_g1_i1.p1 TRINITY_DN2450_c0_g1~~TRINITY_DN2450_c0_g1_i1.p1  ORF type:complete len:505 (+),score=102.83 TRINITY_DN2450_c0_g1_i1:88-1602(+)